MNKIVFTSGIMEKLTADYYTLVLYNSGRKVYAATLDRLTAATVIDKHNNISIKS